MEDRFGQFEFFRKDVELDFNPLRKNHFILQSIECKAVALCVEKIIFLQPDDESEVGVHLYFYDAQGMWDFLEEWAQSPVKSFILKFYTSEGRLVRDVCLNLKALHRPTPTELDYSDSECLILKMAAKVV